MVSMQDAIKMSSYEYKIQELHLRGAGKEEVREGARERGRKGEREGEESTNIVMI